MIPSYFNLDKFVESNANDEERNPLNKTESMGSNLKILVQESVKKGLVIEDVLELDFQCYKKVEVNLEVLKEIRANIHLIKSPKGNKCYFLKGNIARVAKNPDDGVIRYFSRYPDGTFFHLDIVDIYMFIKDKEYGQAVTDLLIAYKIKSEEEARKEVNRDMYRTLIDLIDNDELSNYKFLNKVIGKYYYVLKMIAEVGLTKVYGDSYTYKSGKPVFTMSSRYLCSLLEAENGVIDNRMIGKVINLFCLVGIINKVRVDELPDKFKESNKKLKKKKIWEFINTYSMSEISHNKLEEMEKMAELMYDNKLTIKHISYKRIKDVLVFGEELAVMVYPNKLRQLTEPKTTDEKEEINIRNIEPSDFLANPLF